MYVHTYIHTYVCVDFKDILNDMFCHVLFMLKSKRIYIV